MAKNVMLTQEVLALAMAATNEQHTLLWHWLNELSQNIDFSPSFPDGNHADMLLFRKLTTHLRLRKSEATACVQETAHVISYLNQKTGSNYDVDGKANVKLITDLIRSGRTVAECLVVIDYNVKRWLGTKYESGLNPKKLFSDEFQSYLNYAAKQKNQPLPAAGVNRVHRAIDAAADVAKGRAGISVGGLFPEG